MPREPGEKLGARLSQLMLRHNLALRAQLAPIEAKIAAAGTQQVIDRAGAEVASLYRPLITSLIEGRASDMHPVMLDFLQRTASGEHQFESIAGGLQMAGTSALSSVLSNYLFPVTSGLNLGFRNLPVDAQTAAAAAAAGLTSPDEAAFTAGAWGYVPAAAQVMYQLAQQVPSPPQIYQLYNRGLIDRPGAVYWLQRSGIPPQLIEAVLALAGQVLDPADAALAVLRGNMTQADGYAAAAASGVSREVFDILVGNTGEPPAIEEMLLLNRRNLLSEPLLDRAILQSRIRDEWLPYVKLLTVTPPSAAEVLNATVQGQIPAAESVRRFAEAGGDPTWYQAALDSTANSPAPVELAQMANRGIIPFNGKGPGVVSWEQGFLEGRWKDKWEAAYRAAAVYHPPPREIATLVREGGITQDEAMTLWQQAGLSADLAHVYWTAAHYQKTSAVHELAQGEITRLYTDRAITRDEAMAMLESDRWTPGDANWLLDITDLALARSLLEKAVAKIGALFIAWKITAAAARSALAALEIPATEQAMRISVWTLERGSNVRTLTSAEITDAWYYQLTDPATAQAMLEAIGYTPHESWLLLNIKNKGPIAGYPDPGGT